MEDRKLKIGFTCTNDGVLAAKKSGSNSIGDWVCLTSFPENFYKLTGDRIIDVDKTWVFDSNPYVNREDTAEQIIDTKPAWFRYGRNSPVMMSFADSLMSLLGTDKLPWLRHPKFYRYEDEEIIPTRIIFHPEGAQNKSTPRVLKYSTIQYILEKYKKFDICHVGGKDDASIGHGVHDCRGMDLWEVVELTSKAAIFIGVDSGPYHIAQAYPRINRKLIITEDQFKTDWPRDSYILDPKRDVTYWYDWDTMFFNEFGIDVGITTSYLKI